MTKTQFRLGALLILAAILLHNLTSPDRYKVVTGSTDLGGYLVDGVTGKTSALVRLDTFKVKQ